MMATALNNNIMTSERRKVKNPKRRMDTPKPAEMVIKPANIRIWCHDRDLGRLQQVVWRGQGARLRTEVSSQPAVKRFLEAVPHIMGSIKDIHTAVIQNDMEKLKDLTEDPIPPIILSSQDINGLSPLHKAAGLGHEEMVEYIASRLSGSANAQDAEGRTPLHWAVLPKDDYHIYNTLINHGAEEGKLDNKSKSAGFYKNRPTDIDKSLLYVIPEAPRVASATYPSSWDWELLKSDGQQIVSPPKPKKIVEAKSKNVPKTLPVSVSKEALKMLSPITDSQEMLTETTDNIHNHLESDNELDKDLLPDDDEEEFGDPFEKSTKDRHTSNSMRGDPHELDKGMGIKNEIKSKTPISGRQTGRTTGHRTREATPRNETEFSDNENEFQSPDGDELDDGKLKRPEIQDIEDEMADVVPDITNQSRLSRTHSKQIVEDEDDEDVHVRGEESPSEYGDMHKTETADVLDVEQFKQRQSTKGRASRGSESTIEGVVNADPEVDSLDAEQKENDVNHNVVSENVQDDEVHALIEAANMEQLAALVLNGEGERLVGQTARNPELQAFLDNVPSYMNKIKRVHLSARDGGLRELQAALDRRKFAVARDRVSPNGATPLHVAVLFGHTPVLKYLAGRFPETLSAVDFEGRTALHYAAILKDNGNYYGILQNMGANVKDQDDNGRTPEDYLDNEKYLSHKQLLKDFGAEETLADEILNDKVNNDVWSSRRTLEDPDILGVLGRCYSLLQNSHRTHLSATRSAAPASASANQGPPATFLGRFLHANIYDRIKYRTTKLDHNLFDVIWPAVKKIPEEAVDDIETDFNGGVVAPDYYAYAVFQEFLMPLIKDLHCINMYSELQNHPESLFLPKPTRADDSEEIVPFLVINLDLDIPGKYVLAGTIECSRNLDDFELPLNMNVGQLESVERKLTSTLLSNEFKALFNFEGMQTDGKAGVYYTMSEVLESPSEVRAILAASGLLIPLCDTKDFDDDARLHGKHWPYARGVFISHDANIAVWINVQDHIRVISCTNHNHPGEIGKAYSLLSLVMIHLQSIFNYKWDEKLGFLSARPSFLGNSLHFALMVNLPYLSKDPEHLKKLCSVRGLNYRSTKACDIVRIGNYQSLGLTELQTFHDFTTAIANILQLERDLAMQNSMHIAEMFVNIFRRKRASLVDSNN